MTRRGRKMVWAIGLAGGMVLALQAGPASQALAGGPASASKTKDDAPPPAAPQPTGDSSSRWVAVICGNIPVTREEFGEYLIARHTDKLELLVNKKIIEHACQLRHVEVTDAEIDAALAEDLNGMKIDLNTFVSKVLKQYRKSLFEWREDVIRPKLAMTKLCKDRVHITDKDYRDAFEAYYGEKVECRLILWPQGEEKHAMNAYGDLRKDDAAFDHAATQQASPSLASTGGRVRPIGHHTTGNEELEAEAFRLQPGEVSRLIGTPEGTVVLKCVRRTPADASKKFETERPRLEKEIFEKKVQQEIPKLFKDLQEQAQAKLFLKKFTTEQDLERDVKQALHTEPAKK